MRCDYLQNDLNDDTESVLLRSRNGMTTGYKKIDLWDGRKSRECQLERILSNYDTHLERFDPYN